MANRRSVSLGEVTAGMSMSGGYSSDTGGWDRAAMGTTVAPAAAGAAPGSGQKPPAAPTSR